MGRRFRVAVAYVLHYSYAARTCDVVLPATTGARVVVVGGGASGYFAAIAAKREFAKCEVVLLESARSGLRKVRVSGGGRCNVMHRDDVAIRWLVENYPRGRKELMGPMTARFGPRETREFFENLGVELKVEGDGRVFPTTDNSETIASALESAARDTGVVTLFGHPVSSIEAGFVVAMGEKRLRTDAVVLATGSSPAGYKMAAALGHTLEHPYPSLFSFRLRPGPLSDLAGVSFDASLTLQGTRGLTQRGPVLCTHRGLSGPCALRLSAFAAKTLKDQKYAGVLHLNSLPDLDPSEVLGKLRFHKQNYGAQFVDGGAKGARPFHQLPKRLWASLSSSTDFSNARPRWAELTERDLVLLADRLTDLQLHFSGKDTNKDEFVTAGGVRLCDVDLRTMSSKICDGLHFCGELLDCDGVTGGFNFQMCWTSGFIAGTSAARSACRSAPS